MNSLCISKMTGKLKGLGGLATNPQDNKFCREQCPFGVAYYKLKEKHGKCTLKAEGDLIPCYSLYGLDTYRKSAAAAWTRNGDLLSKPLKSIPSVSEVLFRFNPHGELLNYTHLLNLVKIARNNPDTYFALWTKRVELVERYTSKKSWPDNMTIIYSAPSNKLIKDAPEGFHKVFNVLTQDKIDKDKVKINCGAESCLNCRICYKRNTTSVVIERSKK